MPRQTITLSEPNNAWIKQRVESGEYATQTEAVRAKLIKAEARGFTDTTLNQIWSEARREQLPT